MPVPEDGVTSARWPLFAILVAGFTLRLAAVVSFKGTIDPEGTEYARIAENLLAGHGYVGIATPARSSCSRRSSRSRSPPRRW